MARQGMDKENEWDRIIREEVEKSHKCECPPDCKPCLEASYACTCK